MATSGSEAELMRKYEGSLRQVEMLMHENEGLDDSLQRMRQEFQQVILAKNAEIEELEKRLKDNVAQSLAGRG
jgi:hypothetical protein